MHRRPGGVGEGFAEGGSAKAALAVAVRAANPAGSMRFSTLMTTSDMVGSRAKGFGPQISRIRAD